MTSVILAPTVQPRPAALTDLRGGYHPDLLGPGTLTFLLTAPHKPYVSLVGDFNGWNSRAHSLATDGTGLWWTTIAHPGATRYGFYVARDEDSHVWVGDPYAREVRWDESGPWAWLPPPGDVAEWPTFGWQATDWHTPPLGELVIYELVVRDFVGRWVNNRPLYGTFRGVQQRLDYLVELGVNAIELMPVQQFPGRSSWGYNPVFYFAPAASYGRPQDLRNLIDAAHQRGLAVILDLVCNHATGDHPYYQIYPEMYGPHGEWLPDWNPFFHHTPDSVNMWGGVDWDHFAPETTAYFQDVVRFWLDEYRVDGFRFDWVGGVDYDSRNPGAGDFDPYHGISALCWAARQAKPDVILIGEYWPVGEANPEKTGAELVEQTEMDAVWNGDFHHTLEDVLNQGWEWEKRDIFRGLGGFREQGFSSAAQTVNYSCSHDEVRIVHEILFYARQHIHKPQEYSWTETALAKGLLGLIALLGAPGVPLLWMGQEWGEDAPRTIDFLPLAWERLEEPIHAAQWQRVQRLIHARQAHPALGSDHIEFLADDFARTGLVRFRRWDDSGQDQALVALNFSGRARRTSLPFPWDGPWQEAVSGQVHRVRRRRRSFSLAPWRGRLYVPGALAVGGGVTEIDTQSLLQ